MLNFNIKNFQSIHETSFPVSGFTVLVGENDIGKSSSFRAIHSVFNNRSGDSFITVGKPYASVSCSFEDKCITWEKPRKSGASYELTIAGNKERYDKVGRGAPEFISALGFGEITLKSGKIDPHFSRQREEPFLVSSTSSKQILTEFFSELLKFGPLGKGLIQVSKDIRRVNTDLNVLHKQKVMQEQTLELFPDIEKLKVDYASLKEEQQKLDKNTYLLSLLSSYNSYEEVSVPDQDDYFSNNLKLLSSQISILEKVVRYNSCYFGEDVIPELNIEDDLAYLSFLKSCASTSKIELPDFSSSRIKYLEFLFLSLQIKKLEHAQKDLADKEKEAETSFSTALASLGVCPLCERSVSHV